MGLKLAVVGGGSTYTPELVDGFARRVDRVRIDEIALLDIDPERLAIVGGLAERMLARQGWAGRVFQTTDRDAAIDGADFVLIQLRVGGQRARLGDETLPPRFDLIGQETVGVGGFAKALRTVPVVLELAEAVARRSAPGAWIVDFTNPVGIVTQALADAGHRSIGLCNVAIGFQRRFAARFDVEPERVELEQVGLNHLTWIRAVRVDGVDRLPEILEQDAEELAGDVHITTDRLVREQAIPSYYLRYYDDEAGVIAEARTKTTRAEEVMEIEHDLLELYRDPTLDTKPELLEHRGGAFYSEAAAQLIASLTDGRGDIQVVDVRNEGTLPGLADADVVEVPARIDRDGAHPIPQAPLSPAQYDLVSRVKAYERLTIRAAVSGDPVIARAALAANPLAGDPDRAGEILEAVFEGNARWLPNFFPDGWPR
ncbi:MAG TPA: 6-phospho-beta-glucosidase [Candidatus Limnocylindrales bacterium]|nr:6-phospho-beta-glucosidase [Candidatus Limnocylindrales bacterium]